MNKTFKTSIKRLPAMPRSKRRRASGAGASGGGTIVYNGVAGHQHSNLPQLEQIDTDADGYLWLRRTVEDGSAVETSVEKVRAGYADMAHDLDADSPVRGQFLSRITEDNALERITFDKGIRVGSIVINEVNGLLHVSKGLYSDGGITALGINQEGTGGSGSGSGSGGYPLMTDWSDNVSTGNKALDAWLAKGLKSRVDAIESNYVAGAALANYVTGALSGYVTTAALNGTLSGFVTNSALNYALSGYVTTAALNSTLSGYLPLTGNKKMTGRIILGDNVYISRDSSETGHALLYFNGTDTLVGQAVNNTGGLVLRGEGDLKHRREDGTLYSVLDAYNYASKLDGRYVKKAGDTMSGMLTAPIVTVTSKLVIGGIELTVDNGLLHIKGGMYADGGITALGINQEGTGGSGTGGGGYPLLLSWNESAASGEKALDAYLAKGLKSRVDAIESNYVAGAALANYVTGAQLTGALSGYVTTAALNGTLSGFVTNSALTYALSGYLPLTGGTLYSSSTNSPLSVRQGIGSGTARVAFEKSDGTLLGGLGVSVGGAPMFVNASGAAYKLLHNGDYTTTLDGRYLKLTGGTLSGRLDIAAGLMFTSTPDSANNDTHVRFNNGTVDTGRIGGNNAGDVAVYAKNKIYLRWGCGNNITDRTKGLILSDDGSTLSGGLNVSGNVGVGTNSPTEKLHVEGNVKATGSVTAPTVCATSKLVIGSVELTEENGLLRVSKGLYSEGGITALGVNPGADAPGTGGYPLLSDWAESVNLREKALDAYLAKGLKARVDSIESNYVAGAALANYVTKASLNSTLSGYVTTAALNGTLSGFVTNSALTYALSGYLPLTGGTLTGELTIETGTLGMLVLKRTTVGSGVGIVGYNNTTKLGDMVFNRAGDWALRHGETTTESVRVTASGNMGIGTYSPTERLHVAGNVYATGNIKSASSVLAGETVSLMDGDTAKGVLLRSGNNVKLLVPSGYTTISGGGLNVQTTSNGWANLNSGNLSVNGTASVTGTATVGNLTSQGWVTALDTRQTSDIRRKRVLGPVELTVEDVAGAPAFRFTWKDQGAPSAQPTGTVTFCEQAGTAAQYWQQVLPQTVREADGSLTLNYGVTALLSAIATARRTVENTERIAAVEREIERLTNELKELKGQ